MLWRVGCPLSSSFVLLSWYSCEVARELAGDIEARETRWPGQSHITHLPLRTKIKGWFSIHKHSPPPHSPSLPCLEVWHSYYWWSIGWFSFAYLWTCKKLKAMYPFKCALKKKLMISLLLSKKLSLIKSQYKVNNIATVHRCDRQRQSGRFWEMQHKHIWVGLIPLSTGNVLNNTCPILARGYVFSCNKKELLNIHLHETFIPTIIIWIHKR